MKKTIYILGMIVAGIAMSCNDYLEAPTKSSLDASVIFSTPDLAKGAIDGILISLAETNSYRGRFLPNYGINTDIEWFNTSENTGSRPELAKYLAAPNNTDMNTANNAWAMMYQGIERANLCIEGLRQFGNPQPGTELGQ